MCEKGIDPPFDLKDERVFHYDLSLRAIHRNTNLRSLTEMIESVRRLKGVKTVPFGENLLPLNADAASLPVTVWVETNAPGEYWRNLVGGSRHKLYVAGISFTGWRGIQGMREALSDIGRNGCDVKILTMDVDNLSFHGLLNPDVTGADLQGQRTGIAQARDWFSSALDGAAEAEVRSLRKGSLFQQIIFSDDRCLISPYLYSANTGHSPCMEIQRTSKVFETFLHEFNLLWDANKPSDLRLAASHEN